ncbi:RagB/SusD family nutrient uptake outer membrane protein [Flavicella sediminum]|uniref:RagB/SusD family nutrient uptake outer membrane protein n=1 Tax=Flavicella sediminum TaxID=2585141 RepID=UPI00112375B0|nr:RagB/SusD family nutrient uptake outer membrane protein [Flavicella sediminum]
MKNYIKYILGLTILMGSFQSCESYLDEVNPNNVSADIFWSNLEETETALTAVYGATLNQYILGIDYEAWRSDIGYPKSRRTPYGAGLTWHEQRFSNSGTFFSRSWEGMYQVIWRANQLIEGLNALDAEHKSEERWTTQMAEARFFRGLMHFWLHSNYNNGKIILRDAVPIGKEEYSKGFSTSKEVLDFFREDLKYAYENLPAIQEKKTRVSAGLAALVLGKSYLYTASDVNPAPDTKGADDYAKAMLYLGDVVNNQGTYGYSLLQGADVKQLFTSAGDYNSESIYELNYSSLHQVEETAWDEESFFHRWSRYFGPTGSVQGNAYVVPSSWITYAYSSEVMDANDTRNYKGDTGSTLNSVSLRCAQMCAVVNDEESEYYQYETANKGISFGNTTFSNFKKLTNHDIAASESDVLETAWKSGKNVVVYRLADAYLMYAECLIQTGDLAGGMEYINEIRKRWGLQLLGESASSPAGFDYDEVAHTKETLMNHLMYVEKPLELSLEGYAERAIDLRRWGVTKSRFEHLASLDFQLENYAYTTAEGGNASRNASLIKPGIGNNSEYLNNEYNAAADNFDVTLHAYLPLPLSEVLYNSEINK